MMNHVYAVSCTERIAVSCDPNITKSRLREESRGEDSICSHFLNHRTFIVRYILHIDSSLFLRLSTLTSVSFPNIGMIPTRTLNRGALSALANATQSRVIRPTTAIQSLAKLNANSAKLSTSSFVSGSKSYSEAERSELTKLNRAQMEGSIPK
jgi:hypothetical protein